MTELGARSKVGAPHVVKVSADILPIEQSGTFQNRALFGGQVFSYERGVCEGSVNLDQLVVAVYFDT